MSTESPSVAAPTIRPILWRGVPLHYVIPVAIALLGIGLLLLGGGAAWFGGWWLATALPIAIGGLFRDPRLVAVPAAVWALWLIIGAAAGPDATLANTPLLIGVALAALGAGATYLAQRAIFPATDPETLEAIRHARVVPTLDDVSDDEPTIEPLPVEEGEDLDPALVEAIEVAEGTEPETALAANADVAEPEAEGAAADEPEEPETEEPEVEEPEVEEPEPEEPAADATDAEAPETEPVAAEAPEAEPEADPLDEGQHAEEFAAITEEDLARAESESK